jgi:hypothetical protein
VTILILFTLLAAATGMTTLVDTNVHFGDPVAD